MFCIAAFIIFAILGIFSARYRKLAGQAWQCVAKKVTFRPCDVNFGEQVKGHLLGKLILTHPIWYKFFKRWFDVLAFIFVILSIWSFLYVAVAGINLFVYDTCKPQDAESCSLSGEACSISQNNPTFIESLKKGQVWQWAKTDIKGFETTLSLLPTRFKNWKPQEYITSDNTYYAFNSNKPTALEIVDPGCIVCAKLFGNIETSNFTQKYNLTYIVYPIPDSTTSNGYKFANSYLIASYLEAIKQVPPESKISATPADWQLLQKIFTSSDMQSRLDYSYTPQQTEGWIQTFLLTIGYNQSQVQQIQQLSQSDNIKQQLQRQKDIVEKQVRTVKIPTIMFGGRIYERLIDVSKLK